MAMIIARWMNEVNTDVTVYGKSFIETYTLNRGIKKFGDKAKAIIKANVEASLARFEPPARICDFMVTNSIISMCGSGILVHLPSPKTIWNYVLEIDEEVTAYMIGLMQMAPGLTGVAFDGVTALSRSLILYTIGKGQISMFVGMTQLGSAVHVPAAEINDAISKLEAARAAIGCSLCSVAVDNAAAKVATSVIDGYARANPTEPKILRVRDPSHCLDLVAKDSTKVKCFADLYQTAKTLIKFLTLDRVVGIIEEAVRDGTCHSCPKVCVLSETRFYGAADMFQGLLMSKPIFDIIEGLEDYKTYYRTRDTNNKKGINEALQLVNRKLWQALEVAINWYSVIREGTKLTSSEAFPMSAYLPLCQAIRNGLNYALTNGGGEPFDSIFGDGSKRAIADFVRERFNMDGKETAGRKVGLLDSYQIWCFLADPFHRYLEPQISIKYPPLVDESAAIVYHASKMLDFFAPGVDNNVLRSKLNTEFKKIHGQEPPYSFMHMSQPKDILSLTDAKVSERTLTIPDVKAWVKMFGNHSGRLTFFNTLSPTDYFVKIIEPLLSIKATGSISVERAAKPLKHGVATKERNRLVNAGKAILLHVGLNLRIKNSSLKAVKSTLADTIASLDPNDSKDEQHTNDPLVNENNE